MGERPSFKSNRLERKEVSEMIRLTASEKLLIKRLFEHGYSAESIGKDFEITEEEVKQIAHDNKKEK